MKQLLLTGLLIALTHVANADVANLNCVLTQQSRTPQGKLIETSSSAALIKRTTGEQVLEAEVVGGALIVKFDDEAQSYRLTIVEPPSYTDGVVALLKPEASSPMVLFKIRNSLVLKAVCQEKKN